MWNFNKSVHEILGFWLGEADTKLPSGLEGINSL